MHGLVQSFTPRYGYQVSCFSASCQCVLFTASNLIIILLLRPSSEVYFVYVTNPATPSLGTRQ